MISLLAGFSVALAAQRQISNGARLLREPYLPGLLLFECLVLLPTGLYLFLSQPAWSMLYLVEPDYVTGLFLTAVVIGSLVIASLAYLTGYLLCARRRSGVLALAFALVCLGGLIFAVLAGGRLTHLAAHGDWQAAPGLLSTRLGIMFAFIIPVVFGGWIFLVVLFAMEGRKMQRARIGTVRADSNRGAGLSRRGSLLSASSQPAVSPPAGSEPNQAASNDSQAGG